MNIFSQVFGDSKKHLLQRYKGFESRPQQAAMVGHMMDVFKNKKHGLVEAGTGVGKSLAYLLPIIHWSGKTGKKVVISTFTKALQEQLVRKDLPRLKDVLGIDFKYALCVGSQNFLCKRRLQKNGAPTLFANEKERQQLKRITEWAHTTETGMSSDLFFAPNNSLWSQIRRESELCMRRKSPYFNECFYYKKRKEMFKAQIFITNHHLFFANIASGGKVLPPFDAVVFDEAHTLEDVVTKYLGSEVNNYQIRFHLDSYGHPKTGRGFWRRIKGLSKDNIQTGIVLAEEIRNASEVFFHDVMSYCGQESAKVRIRDKGLFSNHLQAPVHRLTLFLEDILKTVETKENELELCAFIKKLHEIVDTLNGIIDMKMPDYVYWIEKSGTSRGTRCSLHSAPLDISREFRQKVLDRIRPAVFVSATLSVNNSFDFYKRCFGIKEGASELIAGSPFDYKNNVLLYLPEGMPDPGKEPEEYSVVAFKEVKRMVTLMRGRMFVLFTNSALMRKVSIELKTSFPDLHVLMQGEMSTPQLISKFKKNPRSVLLGTNTFWQGVDIPGRALECVVIWKLPFSVPDDPAPQAKMEKLTKEGKNAFVHYQLPKAIVMTRQGFGRLIRTQTDKGIVAILDPRIKTKSYGERFFHSLPECKKGHTLDDVKEFLKQLKGDCVHEKEAKSNREKNKEKSR